MKKNTLKTACLSLFLFAGPILSCKEDGQDQFKPKTITDIIYSDAQFGILREIIVGTKMGDALRTEELTLFAPNDAAFRKSGISASSVISLPKDSAMSFVKYHILGQYKRISDLSSGKLTALNKGVLQIRKSSDSTVQVNRALVITKNVKADNGVVHIVDRVLTEK